jgi:hypothetical protein
MTNAPELAACAALAAFLCASAPGGTAVAQTAGQAWTIALTGEAEGPGLGDPDGSGSAELKIDPEKGELCYVLKASNISPARLSHIHKSPAGQAGGPIVVNMTPPTEGHSEGCVAIRPAVALELLTSPAEFYVNIHNPEYPGGAIRGQLDTGRAAAPVP